MRMFRFHMDAGFIQLLFMFRQMRMQEGQFTRLGVHVEQRSVKGCQEKRDDRIPGHHASHGRIVTKRSAQVNSV